MHVCRLCLSPNVHNQHVSVTVAAIFWLTYKNIMNPNSLSTQTRELLNVTKNVLNFNTVTEYQLIYY